MKKLTPLERLTIRTQAQALNTSNALVLAVLAAAPAIEESVRASILKIVCTTDSHVGELQRVLVEDATRN